MVKRIIAGFMRLREYVRNYVNIFFKRKFINLSRNYENYREHRVESRN